MVVEGATVKISRKRDGSNHALSRRGTIRVLVLSRSVEDIRFGTEIQRDGFFFYDPHTTEGKFWSVSFTWTCLGSAAGAVSGAVAYLLMENCKIRNTSNLQTFPLFSYY